MTITVTAHADSDRLRTFPAFAERRLMSVVREGLRVGTTTMKQIVPRGKGTLASAVGSSGPTIFAPGHIIGSVGVDEKIAPHARKVNVGTGIDGPHRQSVVVNRTSRNGKGSGAMKFVGSTGEWKGITSLRREVKFIPSNNIQQGKNFDRKTYRVMREWAYIRVSVLSGELAHYFSTR